MVALSIRQQGVELTLYYSGEAAPRGHRKSSAG
jgi:hypothetical protein